MNELKQGYFSDEIEGLHYETPSISGKTDAKGMFLYREGDVVTFSIGSLVLGAHLGEPLITPAHLDHMVGGDIHKIKYQKATNLAVFLQSLTGEKHLEKGFVITDEQKQIIEKYSREIRFDQPSVSFQADSVITKIFQKLGLRLRSPEQARNHMRRTLHGIRKLTDVKVPMRDDSYILADVFMPLKPGKYPVIMSHAGYGKAFWLGCIRNEEEFEEHERMEDDYFEGIKHSSGFIEFHAQELAGVPAVEGLPPKGSIVNPVLPHVSENFEVANTLDWVPNGYIVIRTDGRGMGDVPGQHEQFSYQEAMDYYDAIEWAGTQDWSNGNVGLYGASYYAMNMYPAAAMNPPHLKAMIPIAGDLDMYRDVLYPGGIYNTFNFVARNSCKNWSGKDFVEIAKKQPFDNPEQCPCTSTNPEDIKVPFWSIVPLESPRVHTRGSSEAYIHGASQSKKLSFCSETGVHFWMYTPEHLKKHQAFFDYWLKGIQNGIMDEPPVELMIRSGNGGYYYQTENEWPVARTEYRKFYLDVGTKQLIKGKNTQVAAQASYAADGQRGIRFTSEPFESNTVLSGYFRLKLWCSSTSRDMAVQSVLRVFDEYEREVTYSVQYTYPVNHANPEIFPIAQGELKVSHRKTDFEKNTVYRPYHTHKEEDYQPLRDGEIVECDIELLPSSALIRKGWKLALEICPAQDTVDDSYRKQAVNTIYTGGDYESWLQIPVI
ncbi:CocE/NonD family hydrolase [Paenibacillus sp. Lou8.1]|uniref:CocE/NonD family hydrolase n=1 Tax=Paenibacillus sp. Lou8.1 TaxID=2962041 RepID=UPI0020B871F5|nr:CocE/NonD family hydrolase [Paenibacillus sp. Lou8.1]MCP3807825.1 CocE/NonD family hydrolase [Paenibacillus sp. Lou8.1]